MLRNACIVVGCRDEARDVVPIIGAACEQHRVAVRFATLYALATLGSPRLGRSLARQPLWLALPDPEDIDTALPGLDALLPAVFAILSAELSAPTLSLGMRRLLVEVGGWLNQTGVGSAERRQQSLPRLN